MILPATTTLTETLSSASTYAIIFVVALLTGEAPRLTWIAVVPLFMLQVVFNLGAATVMARLTTHFRDTTQILPFVFRLLLYGSGVIFSVSAYANGNQKIELLFALNPFYGFVTMTRWAVMGSDNVSVFMLVATTLTSVLVLVFGTLWFRRGEEGYARD